jgi:predicted esterase
MGSASFVIALPPKQYVESRFLRTRRWFDFRGFVRSPKNLVGYEDSFEYVADLVRHLQRLSRPIYLAGFGQGGALAMDVAYSSRSELKSPVKGVVCFSGYFIVHDEQWDTALEQTELLWAHSIKNKKVPYAGAVFGLETQLKKKRGLAKGKLEKFEALESQRLERTKKKKKVFIANCFFKGTPLARNRLDFCESLSKTGLRTKQ